MANGKRVVERHTKLRSQLNNFLPRWELIAKYFAPTRFGVMQGNAITVGANIIGDVFDSTGPYAADLFGNFLSGKIINPSEKWCGITAEDPIAQKDDEVREWCEESRDRLLADYAKSNFYTAGTETIKDYGVFANGSMFGGERPYLPTDLPRFGYRGSHYITHPIGRYVIGENAAGEVDTQIVEFKMTARAAIQSWPKGDFSPALLAAAKSDQDQEFDFLYAVMPRDNSERFGQYGNKKMPYSACYVEKDSQKVFEESGFEVFPFTNGRYGKRWGEFYGRGFGELCLHDAQTLNLAKRMGLEDWALKIRPPILAKKGITGTMRIKPAGLTILDTKEPLQNAIMPWQSGSHPEVSQIKEEELRQSILQGFYVDKVIKLMEIENLRDMTATAYIQTLNLLFGLLGPVYTGLESGWLRPRVEADVFRLYRNGVFSRPPDMLLETGGNIRIDFQNPLARAQKMGELEAMDQALTRLRPLADAEMALKGYSESFDWLDIDAWAQKVFEVTGTPATLVKSMKQVQEIRQARTEQQQQQMAQQQMAMMGETAGKAAPALKLLQGGEQAA